jgi:hypothetical protein
MRVRARVQQHGQLGARAGDVAHEVADLCRRGDDRGPRSIVAATIVSAADRERSEGDGNGERGAAPRDHARGAY